MSQSTQPPKIDKLHAILVISSVVLWTLFALVMCLILATLVALHVHWHDLFSRDYWSRVSGSDVASAALAVIAGGMASWYAFRLISRDLNNLRLDWARLRAAGKPKASPQ